MKKFKKALSILMAGILSFQNVGGVTNDAKSDSKFTSYLKNSKTDIAIAGGVISLAALSGIGIIGGTAAALFFGTKYLTNSSPAAPTSAITPDYYLNSMYPGLLPDCLKVNDMFKNQSKDMRDAAVYKINQLLYNIPKFYHMHKKTYGQLTFNVVLNIEVESNPTANLEGCYRSNNIIEVKSKWFSPQLDEIEKKAIYYAYPPAMRDELKKNASCPLELVVSHEVGHMFHNVFNTYIENDELKNSYDSYLFSIDGWKQRIIAIAKSKYHFYDTKITRYGEQDSDEWFAELFAGSMCGGIEARYPLCLAFWDFIIEITNKIN